jgi:hypothetical protein
VTTRAAKVGQQLRRDAADISEALVGAIDRRAERKCASRGRVIFDQQYFQPEHAEHLFQRYRPHLLMFAAGIAAVLAKHFSGVPGRKSAKPVNLQAREFEFVRVRPACLILPRLKGGGRA